MESGDLATTCWSVFVSIQNREFGAHGISDLQPE
jgi:hypothetical protein